MNNKEEIKKEIYELAKKISDVNSEDVLLQSARELYEKTVLLKYLSTAASQEIKQENKNAIEIPAKSGLEEIHTEKKQNSPVASQVNIDLFSSDASTINSPVERPPVKVPKQVKKKSEESVAEKLQHKKITDLKASIGINEKFQFINELFEGNMKEYTVAIDQINSFSSMTEAESYIDNLTEVYKWNSDNQIVGNFKELVERRFTS